MLKTIFVFYIIKNRRCFVIEKIKEHVNKIKFDNVNHNIIYLTLGGSHAYGTNVKSSDIDIRGIFGDNKSTLLGLDNCDMYEFNDSDTVLYSLKKMVKLLIKANPNVLELLATKKDHILKITEEGKILRDNLDLFLSQKVAKSFGGYANNQLRRIKNAKLNIEDQDKEKDLYRTLEYQLEDLKERYEKFTGEDNIEIYLDESDKKSKDKEIFISANLNHYPLRDFKNIYSGMQNTVKNFGRMTHKNKRKSEKKLLKHAMHLVRLYLMGIEILTTGKVNTYRYEDKDLLLSIRNGEFLRNKDKLNWSKFFDYIDHLEEKFKKAKNNSVLPKKVDYNKINNLVMEINQKIIKKF
jgi:predicted nucleotidyltransferase